MKFEGEDGRPAKQSSFLNKINKTILMGHPPKNGQLVQVEHSRQIETYLTNIESKLDCDQDIAPQQKVRAVRLPPPLLLPPPPPPPTEDPAYLQTCRSS